MRQTRSLRFDSLEGRMLLSKIAHQASAPAAVPMVLSLDGTIVVDMKAASQSNDSAGDSTTMVPVTGHLGTLGKVQGVWSDSTDPFGDYLGPDTIEFSTKQGTFTIAFNSSNLKNPQKMGKERVFPPLGQQLYGATGVYSKATEHGSIQVITNPSKGVAETMTIVSTNPVISG